MKLLNEIEVEFMGELARRMRIAETDVVALRGFEFLPHKILNDVDFLVEQIAPSVRLVTQVAREFDFEAKILESRFEFTGLLMNGGIRLDFFSSLVKRWSPYLDSRTVFSSKIEDGNMFPYVSPSCFVAMVAGKEFLTYGCLRPEKMLAVKSCIRENSIAKREVEDLLAVHFRDCSVKVITDHIFMNDLSSRLPVVSRRFFTLAKPIAASKWLIKRF